MIHIAMSPMAPAHEHRLAMTGAAAAVAVIAAGSVAIAVIAAGSVAIAEVNHDSGTGPGPAGHSGSRNGVPTHHKAATDPKAAQDSGCYQTIAGQPGDGLVAAAPAPQGAELSLGLVPTRSQFVHRQSPADLYAPAGSTKPDWIKDIVVYLGDPANGGEVGSFPETINGCPAQLSTTAVLTDG